MLRRLIIVLSIGKFERNNHLICKYKMVSSRKLLILSVIIFLAWVGIGFFLYMMPPPKAPVDASDPLVSQDVLKCKVMEQKLPADFWKKVNLQREIPESTNQTASRVVVKSAFVEAHGFKVHYLHARPPDLYAGKEVSVLLLHGKNYDSELWRKLGTLHTIAAFRHYAVAIDLPKPSKFPEIRNVDKAEFLNSVVSALKLQQVVLVSPSMSGTFSLPFLLKHPDQMAGWVPVAPAATNLLDGNLCQQRGSENVYGTRLSEGCERIKGYLKKPPPNLSCIKVPTLIVFGEHDKGANSAKLCFLPNSQGAEIPRGMHAAYKSDPHLFHKLLYNFLSVINETLNCK